MGVGSYRQVTHTAGAIPLAKEDIAWDPIRASVDCWSWYSRLGDIWWTRAAGDRRSPPPAATASMHWWRFARARSPFYREAYRGLPAGRLDPAALPVVTKRALMNRFDDWVTDPALDLAGVTAFLADREHIGERYLGRYVIWKSSGSTGEPGIYVQDDDALETFDALMAVHLDPARFAAVHAWRIAARGGRAALIAATGDHFASIASWQR